MASIATNIPPPAHLKMTGNLASEWNRLCSQWHNYEVAADLVKESKKKRAACFLAFVGTEAYETFLTMEFEEESHKEDIDKVIAAFQKHFVG